MVNLRIKAKGSIKFPFSLSSRMGRLGPIIFLSSIAFALVGSILSVHINSFVNSEAMVGLIFTFLMIISIISCFIIVPLIEKFSKSGIYLTTSIFIAIGYFAYSLIENLYFLILIISLVTFFISLKLASSGLLVKHASKKSNLSENEGFVYTFISIAWLIGPLLAGLILAKYGEKPVFILAALFSLSAGILIKLNSIKYKGIEKKLDRDLIKNLKDFFKDKNRCKAYILSAGITFWWSLIFVYMPLLIIKSFDESYVGYFLFAIMIPLVLFEYLFGRISGKIGFKKIFFLGYLIPAGLAFFCFFYFSNLLFVLIALVLASIGLSMIESTTEAYFFDLCKGKEDQRFYSTYNTAVDLGSLIGEFVSAMLLFFLAFRYIFMFYGIVMFLLSLLALRIKNIIEIKRK